MTYPVTKINNRLGTKTQVHPVWLLLPTFRCSSGREERFSNLQVVYCSLSHHSISYPGPPGILPVGAFSYTDLPRIKERAGGQGQPHPRGYSSVTKYPQAKSGSNSLEQRSQPAVGCRLPQALNLGKVPQHVRGSGERRHREGNRQYLGQAGALLGQAGLGCHGLPWNPHYQCWGYESQVPVYQRPV